MRYEVYFWDENEVKSCCEKYGEFDLKYETKNTIGKQGTCIMRTNNSVDARMVAITKPENISGITAIWDIEHWKWIEHFNKIKERRNIT